MSEPTPNITPEIRTMLTDVVKRQCRELVAAEATGHLRDGKKIADFMKEWVGKFLDFTGFERILLLKFMVETEQAARKAVSEFNKDKGEL